MNEWEAKYKALLAGIDNKEYVENAELLVHKAYELSCVSALSFNETFTAILQAAGLMQQRTSLKPHEINLLNVWPFEDKK